jgi:CheY-like chemotaxis protein
MSQLRSPMSPRILVADPDSDTTRLLRAALPQADIIEARDGRDALVKALGRVPALMLAAVILPIIDGYALCAILRRDAATRGLPIILLTDVHDHERQARDAGASAVITKPVSVELMAIEARRLLSGASVGVTLVSHLECTTEHSINAPPATAPLARGHLKKAYQRVDTRTPPERPPSLLCPLCDLPLAYRYSHLGGVNAHHPEQWDYFWCRRCGVFEYRQRTRNLKRVGGE